MVWVGIQGHSFPKGLSHFRVVAKWVSLVTLYFVLEKQNKKEMFPLSLKAIPISQQLSAAQCSLQLSDSQDNVVFIINQPKRIGPLPRPWDAQLMKIIVALHLVWVHMFLDLSPKSFCFFKGGYWLILGRLWFMMFQLLINNSSSRILETQLATSEQVNLIKLEDTVSDSDLFL